jgi:hypothetical protein
MGDFNSLLCICSLFAGDCVPAVAGIHAVAGVLAVASVRVDPGVPILAGIFAYFTVQ